MGSSGVFGRELYTRCVDQKGYNTVYTSGCIPSPITTTSPCPTIAFHYVQSKSISKYDGAVMHHRMGCTYIQYDTNEDHSQGTCALYFKMALEQLEQGA